MKLCYYDPDHLNAQAYYRELILLFSALSVYMFFEMFERLHWSWILIHLIFFLLGLSFTVFMICDLLVISRKYSISEDALVIEYPFHILHEHPWSSISEVGICKINYSTRGTFQYQTVIRLVVGPENKGPASGYGSWATSLYGVVHFRKVITILYSEEVHREFDKICPMEIKDYRNIRRYFSDPE